MGWGLRPMHVKAKRLLKREPSKHWLVWWKAAAAQRGATCSVCGFVRPLVGGEHYASHCRVFPSKDTAETWAEELLLRMYGDATIPSHKIPDFLCAAPEGESP